MDRVFYLIGALSAFVGVAAGAFGAHGLKERLSAEMLAVFETGVRYQMYHAFALFAAGWAASRWPGGLTRSASRSSVGALLVVGDAATPVSMVVTAVRASSQR